MFSDPKVQVKLLVGQLLVQFGSDVLAEAMGRCGSSFWLEPQFAPLSLSQRPSVPTFYGRWGGCPGSHNLCNAKIERVRAAHLTPRPETLQTNAASGAFSKTSTICGFWLQYQIIIVGFLLLSVFKHHCVKLWNIHIKGTVINGKHVLVGQIAWHLKLQYFNVQIEFTVKD